MVATDTQNTGTSLRRSRAQERATHALAMVDAMAELQDRNRGNYLSYVKALPANIIMSGLGQTMAMEKAGVNDKGHAHLYAHVKGWLCNVSVTRDMSGLCTR